VRAIRFRAALVIGLLALAGCGGGSATTATTAPTGPVVGTQLPTQTGKFTPGTTAITIPTETSPAPKKKKTTTSPEQQPGGAGDETPIATQALFTGKNGTVTPARIRVPPFIAVKVVLQAKDEKGYTLVVAGKEVAVGEGRGRASVRLDGLRPGARYVAKNQFGNRPATLVIVANAEPGP
jgi:hypothetical protein